MHGRDLGVNPDDLLETSEVEQEAKQEILENKDVSTSKKKKNQATSYGMFLNKRRSESRLKHHLYVQVVVQHVNIQGLGRTKEDLLGYEISDVFHARNLIDVRTAGCDSRRLRVPDGGTARLWCLHR